jgi:hypothetical protein
MFLSNKNVYNRVSILGNPDWIHGGACATKYSAIEVA